MKNIDPKIGLIAGQGYLPKTLAANALKNGHQVYAVAINLRSLWDLQNNYTEGQIIPPTQTQKYIDYFRSCGVRQVFIIGKIHKLWALTQIPFLDQRARSYLKRMINFEDNTFHQVLSELAQETNFQLMPQITFLQDCLAPKGFYTQRPLTKSEQIDIDYGFTMAKKAAALEVSQMVVIKNQAVMSFEAAEGTDPTIKRGCKLAKKGAVIIKVAWKKQLDNFDLPTIGPRTIKTIYQGQGSVLAIEADSTFIIEREETIKLANKYQIALLAI